MKEIIGKKITGLFVDSSAQEKLMFTTDNEVLTYECDADCCSDTWFADITGVDALLGGVVASVESVDLGEVEDNRTRQEYDEVYGYKIVTDKGYVDIVYRNSSNGYYGGSCYFKGLDEKPGDNMCEITDDWQA